MCAPLAGARLGAQALAAGDGGMGDDLFAEMAQGLILGPQAGTPAGDPFRMPQAYPSQARARAPAPPVSRLSARIAAVSPEARNSRAACSASTLA